MPLDSEDFGSIARHVELEVGRLLGRKRDSFFMAEVTKRDTENNLIWCSRELGDQPIPLIAFEYEITYYDESPRGTSGGGSFRTYKKTAISKVQVPQKGEMVLIVLEMGYGGRPRCFGVVQSKNFVQDLEDI